MRGIEINDDIISKLKEHLRATYAIFIKNELITIKVNEEKLNARFFENWAYPPNYEPTTYTGRLKTEDGRIVKVRAIGGLTRESSPAAGEYGVYFYCNDRLVARALKTFDVGFSKGFAGLPHPKVSLTRVLVFINGDARSMPWNSSKSDISTKHEVFLALRECLLQVVKDYAALSRIWMGDWPDQVFKYKSGTKNSVIIKNFPEVKKSFLPPLPKSRPRYGEVIKQKNRGVANRKPWTKGLYEGIVAADLISKNQNIEQRTRIALVILDSTIEIAFKEYLVNDSGVYYSDAALRKLFSSRNDVHSEIRKYVNFHVNTWKKITYYNNARNKLIHERSTVAPNDSEIRDFRKVVENVLAKLYKLDF